jgi:hypothetical protein
VAESRECTKYFQDRSSLAFDEVIGSKDYRVKCKYKMVFESWMFDVCRYSQKDMTDV